MCQTLHILIPTMQLLHPCIVDGWFREVSEELFPGHALRLEVAEILHTEKSEFQDVLVFRSTSFGNVLVLDGIVQASERDEFAYQEMIAHVPLFAHPHPRRVLVIGGGDGGVLREVVKHPGVESATLVEIDEGVIRLARTFLPHMAVGFDDPRVTVEITDGFEYLRQAARRGTTWDVVITDSLDPDGPAAEFFKHSYFELLKGVLSEDGVVACMASESVWLDVDKLRALRADAAKAFSTAKVCYAAVPTYTSGQLALLVCSAGEVDTPAREGAVEARYYNARIHQASFVLPTFARDINQL